MLSRNLLYKKIEDIDSVIVVKPILVRRAKLSDMISGSSNGTGGIQLMISDKLKKILESGEGDNIQFFPMSLIYKNIELKNYWLSNPHHFSQEYIDYGKSDCQFRNSLDSKKNRLIDINTQEEFEIMMKKLVWPEWLSISRLVMCRGQRDLLVLQRVYGGVGYYVSERLKYEIEEAQCTGIEFEEIEMSDRTVNEEKTE